LLLEILSFSLHFSKKHVNVGIIVVNKTPTHNIPSEDNEGIHKGNTSLNDTFEWEIKYQRV